MEHLEQEINSYGIPVLHYDRTTYMYDKRVKTTGNVGEIIPIYTNLLVQPGDTFKINLTDFTRLTTSTVPPMDDIIRGIYCFSCSWLSLWDNANKFWGENEDANFNSDPEYTVPKFVIGASDVISNRSILNRLGCPHLADTSGAETPRGNINFERLSYNMYLHIYNYFFRNQNYIPAYSFSKGDEDVTYSSMTLPKNLLKASRFHDYFMGIPEPQFGAPSTLNLGTTADVAIKGDGKTLGLYSYQNDSNAVGGLIRGQLTGTEGLGALLMSTQAYNTPVTDGGTGIVSSYSSVPYRVGVTTDTTKSGLIGVADLANATASTIEAMRVSITEQQIKERLAWYGRLYQNIINSFWGVEPNKENLRLPIYLGGNRHALNMDTVLKTSTTDAVSPQGDPAGYSATLNENGELFTKSFTEHSIIMIVYVARQNHSYSQGINCQHQKFRKYDFFWNPLAGLGAQDIKMQEIYADGSSNDSAKWCCKPAWQEYRVELDEVTGQLAPTATGTLVNYTYTDYYTETPVMSADWVNETSAYVNRTLAVSSEVADQLMIDCNFHITKVTEVPAYNLPGIDRI